MRQHVCCCVCIYHTLQLCCVLAVGHLQHRRLLCRCHEASIHSVQSIESLPLVQTPEVFGLHANADIQYYTTATKALWLHLLDMQPRTGGAAGGGAREAHVAAVATDLMAKVPKPFDTQAIKKGLGVPEPTQVVLLQELERWNACALHRCGLEILRWACTTAHAWWLQHSQTCLMRSALCWCCSAH